MNKSNEFWKRYNKQISRDNRKELEKYIVDGKDINTINKLMNIDIDVILEYTTQIKIILEKKKYKEGVDIPIAKIMAYKHFIQKSNKSVKIVNKVKTNKNTSATIRDEYYNNHLSMKKIANKYGISYKKVLKTINSTGTKIERHTSKCYTTKLNKEDFKSFLENNNLIKEEKYEI